MLSEISGFEEIYIACGRSDLRKGIDGLAALVKEKFDLSPFRRMFYSCSAGAVKIDLKDWYGKAMVLYCYINE